MTESNLRQRFMIKLRAWVFGPKREIFRAKHHKTSGRPEPQIFPEMPLANKYCVGKGLEIGASAHNSFGLNTLNVDLFEKSIWKEEEMKVAGKVCQVDIVASGDDIPVADGSFDFVISSHVLEHFPNVIKVLLEWDRVVKPGGVIFMIVPHKERTLDKDRERTPLDHIIKDYQDNVRAETPDPVFFGHNHVWITEDVVEIINYLVKEMFVDWKIEEVEDVDSKVGNGFTIVCRKLSNRPITHAL